MIRVAPVICNRKKLTTFSVQIFIQIELKDFFKNSVIFKVNYFVDFYVLLSEVVSFAELAVQRTIWGLLKHRSSLEKIFTTTKYDLICNASLL